MQLAETHELLIEPVAGGRDSSSRRRPRGAGDRAAGAIARFRRHDSRRPARILGSGAFRRRARPRPASFPDTLASLDYGWSSYIVVATRGHKLDADCILAAVKTRARYIGLLGSRRKAVLIADMLREEGISEERIKSVHTPVGLDLGGRTPAEIALSVMAEITKERYGR